jgi:hypothetical protein
VYDPVQHNHVSNGRGDKKRFQGCSDRQQRHSHDKREKHAHPKTNSILGFSSMRKRSQECQGRGKRTYKDFKKSKLSEKEKDELRVANKCFNCKEMGHTARTCPHRNNIASSSSNKPPGLQNHNIEITSHEIEYLETLDAMTQSNCSLELAMMTFDGLDLSEEGSSTPGYLTPDNVEDLFKINTDLEDEFTMSDSNLVSDIVDELELQSATLDSVCDDDVYDLESVSESSDESDDDMPDLAEVSDLDNEFDPSTEPILEVLECELNNSYFAELTQLEEINEESKCEYPVQWGSKNPALGNETKDIHLKILNGPQYRRRDCIGDMLANSVQYTLDHEQGFPGDELFPPDKQHPNKYHYRFIVTTVSRDILLILDVQHTRILVQQEFLEDLRISVSGWYAACCREYFNLPCVKGKKKDTVFLGDVYARPAIIALNDGAPYPGEDYYFKADQDIGLERFICWIDKDSPAGDYILHDTDHKIKVQIPLVYLRNPHFNIGGLYCPPVIPAGFLRIPEDSWGFPGLNIG